LKPCLTEPRKATRNGRTWLAYPELDRDGLIHGIVVFKEAPPGPSREWQQVASSAILEQAATSDAAPGRANAALGQVVIPRQVHGRDVKAIHGALPPEASTNLVCDGLVTDAAGVAVGVSVADCIPLLAADLRSGVVGVAHCGWRGTAAGIVEAFVGAFSRLAGTAARPVYVIGAGIGPCCYEVGEDLLGRFPGGEIDRFSERRNGSTYFDLKQVVASRLVAQGAQPAEISIDKTCTACQKYTLSSFRRDGVGCGSMLAFLARVG